MMRRDRFVYISGPMTASGSHTIEDNVVDGLRVYWALLRRGIPAFCPHLSGLYPTAWGLLDHTEWVEYDRRVIDRCTHVLLLPRWEASLGARLEKAYAEEIGVPVVYSIAELEALDAVPT